MIRPFLPSLRQSLLSYHLSHLQCQQAHLPSTVRYASLTGAINRGVRKSQRVSLGGEGRSPRRADGDAWSAELRRLSNDAREYESRSARPSGGDGRGGRDGVRDRGGSGRDGYNARTRSNDYQGGDEVRGRGSRNFESSSRASSPARRGAGGYERDDSRRSGYNPARRSDSFQPREHRTGSFAPRERISRSPPSENYSERSSFGASRDRRSGSSSNGYESGSRYKQDDAFAPAREPRRGTTGRDTYGSGTRTEKEEGYRPAGARGSTTGRNSYESGSRYERREDFAPGRDFHRGAADRKPYESGSSRYERREDFSPSTSRTKSFQARPESDTRSDYQTTRGNGRFSDDTSRNVATPDANAAPRTFSSRTDRNIPISVPYTTPASEFLYGTSVVKAALMNSNTRKRKLYKFYMYQGMDRKEAIRDAQLERLAAQTDVEIRRVSGDFIKVMDKMSAGRPHNGYILEASPLPRKPILGLGKVDMVDGQYGCEIFADAETKEEKEINGTDTWIPLRTLEKRQPFVLLLEGIEDPGNLGGIIRTAAFLGVSAVVVSKHASATFTPVVLKAAAGACEDMQLFNVAKPAQFIHESQLAGWKVFAAVPPGGARGGTNGTGPAYTTDNLPSDVLSESPTILMLGGEGAGLSRSVKSKADVEVAIPGGEMSPLTNSLNVSVAAGVLCAAFVRPKREGTNATSTAVKAASEDSSGGEESAEKDEGERVFTI